jgi:threonine dehydrogenase-like Zn-dependent dehydrogenase
MARALGVDHTVDFKQGDAVEAIMTLTHGRGVDVAIEAMGTQMTFESALRVLRPGGTLSSLGVTHSGGCPQIGGKEVSLSLHYRWPLGWFVPISELAVGLFVGVEFIGTALPPINRSSRR